MKLALMKSEIESVFTETIMSYLLSAGNKLFASRVSLQRAFGCHEASSVGDRQKLVELL